MFKSLATGILLMLLSSHGALNAQQTSPKPFKTLCVSEKETGFNWVSGDWVQANFKPEEKILIQKIVGSAPTCKPDVKDGMFGTTGCYLIKSLGTSPTFLGIPENCDEISEKNSLKVVHCPKISFHPNGRFIRFPWHADISDNPKNGNKDSLILAVGKCSRIVE